MIEGYQAEAGDAVEGDTLKILAVGEGVGANLADGGHLDGLQVCTVIEH